MNILQFVKLLNVLDDQIIYKKWKNESENKRTISKFANFWNFDSFLNWKNSEKLLIFRVVKFWKLFLKNSNLENSSNF